MVPPVITPGLKYPSGSTSKQLNQSSVVEGVESVQQSATVLPGAVYVIYTCRV